MTDIFTKSFLQKFQVNKVTASYYILLRDRHYHQKACNNVIILQNIRKTDWLSLIYLPEVLEIYYSGIVISSGISLTI